MATQTQRGYPGESIGETVSRKTPIGFTSGWRQGSKIDSSNLQKVQEGDVLIKVCNRHQDKGKMLVRVLRNRGNQLTYVYVQRDGATQATPRVHEISLPHAYKDFWKARLSHATTDKRAGRVAGKNKAKAMLQAALNALNED